MNPRDYLGLADALSAGPGEAERRTAVSRAYYAAFHVARDALMSWGFVAPRADSAHGYLWLRLANSGHAGIHQAGTNLNQLRGDRNQADYDFRRPFPTNRVRICVQLARSVIAALDALAADAAARAAVTDAVRAYERDVLKTVTWRRPP